MRILIAGGTGALGSRLVPMLVARGHEVFATTRVAVKAQRLGATPIVLDPLDRDAVCKAVLEAAPEVVVHQLTALSGAFDLKHFDAFAGQGSTDGSVSLSNRRHSGLLSRHNRR